MVGIRQPLRYIAGTGKQQAYQYLPFDIEQHHITGRVNCPDNFVRNYIGRVFLLKSGW